METEEAKDLCKKSSDENSSIIKYLGLDSSYLAKSTISGTKLNQISPENSDSVVVSQNLARHTTCTAPNFSRNEYPPSMLNNLETWPNSRLSSARSSDGYKLAMKSSSGNLSKLDKNRRLSNPLTDTDSPLEHSENQLVKSASYSSEQNFTAQSRPKIYKIRSAEDMAFMLEKGQNKLKDRRRNSKDSGEKTENILLPEYSASDIQVNMIRGLFS